MSTNHNETSDANNVANFNSLISNCVGFKEKFNPSNAKIQIAALKEFSNQSDLAIKEIQVKTAAYNNAVDNRKVIMSQLKALARRVVNAFKASDIREETVSNISGVNRKIQGQRAKPAAKLAKSLGAAVSEENQTIPKTISTSQQGVDKVVSNFSQLIELARAEPAYTPNEPELTIASLEAFYNTVRAANNAVVDAETDLTNARIARNKLMYDTDSNIAALAQSVKNYVKAAFGSSSREYKSISSIKIVSFAK